VAAYAIPNLADDTRRRYLEIWGTHLLPRLGDYELRAITPYLVEDFRADLERAKVPAPTVRKAMMLLQGILRRAVARGLIAANPVKDADKPKQPPVATPQPLTPEMVERIRIQMLSAWSSPKRGAGRSAEELRWWRARNSMILSLLAYEGLRPSEDRDSRWNEMHGRQLHVIATKTNRARDVDLLAPVAQELTEWRLLCGRPEPKSLIVPTLDGDEWKRHDWQNWRRAGLSTGGDRRRRHRRPASLPATRQLRVAPAVGGPLADLRRRTGRPRRGHARQALRRGAPRPRARAARAGRGGDPPGAREAESRRRVPDAGGVLVSPRPDPMRYRCGTRPETRHGTLWEIPANPRVGDAGLEPATSALSRRRSPG
jgi:hypothetical protein